MIQPTLLIGALVVVGGCSHAHSSRTLPPRSDGSATITPSAAPVAVATALDASNRTDQTIITSAVHRSTWLGKPPLAVHRFDVALRNPAPTPQWLVLPRTFPYLGQDNPKPGGSAIEIQVYRLSTEPHALFVSVVGAHLSAVRLPAGGTTTLRNLAIESWWSERQTTTSLEVILTPRIKVGDATLTSLVPAPAVSAPSLVLEAPKNSGDDRALPFWHPEGLAPGDGPPVSFEKQMTQVVNVALDA